MRHRWTEDERDLIRREYRGTLASRSDLAASLGVGVPAVDKQIQLLGMRRIQRPPAWTPEEEERLAYLLARHNIASVAAMMGRSINGIAARTKKLRLSRKVRDGWFTQGEACEILGVESRWLRERVREGALEAAEHHAHDSPARSATLHIEAASLRAFIVAHADALTGRNIDVAAMVALLADASQAQPAEEAVIEIPTAVAEEPAHVHHWKIAPPNGRVSRGVCACGAARDFENAPDLPWLGRAELRELERGGYAA